MTSKNKDFAWIEQHGHKDEYKDLWLALHNGVLIDSDESRIALQNRLEKTNMLDGTLFYCPKQWKWMAEH